MTIYVETFLLQNILIDFCLLRLVYLTTKTGTNWFKMAISAIFGASFSVIGAIFLKNVAILNVIKLVAAIIMIAVCFKCSLKQFVFNFILLFIYTYALGGAITNLCGTAYQTGFGVVVASKINLEVVCVCIIALTYIFEFVVRHIKFKVKTNNLIYPLTLYMGNNKVKINAYMDTGNLLSYNGCPVIIVDLKTYLKLSKTNLINFYIAPGEYVGTGTVSGANKLKIEKIDKITLKIDGKQKVMLNQYIAISNAFDKLNYKALLNPSVV